MNDVEVSLVSLAEGMGTPQMLNRYAISATPVQSWRRRREVVENERRKRMV
jgi:hypothetical protein